jgi:AhpC/TSA family/Thiol:disulfide interchange protein DsbD, N-terminal
VELQGRYDDIRKQGLGLIAISYDSPDTLKKFAESRGITFPLLSDAGSVIIKSFGILNAQREPGTREYGIPHPGTFIVDRQGVVTARFFEDAYQERYTAAAILAARGVNSGASALTAQTDHLNMSASISDTTVAPGERISIVVDVTPRPTMHVYAPGKHEYRVVRLNVDPQPWLRAHDTHYPQSEIYYFKPFDERVEVYSKPFRLVQDVTILATPEVQKTLATMSTVTISGALEYQACDDKVCYNPARVSFSFTVATKALDRKPPG